MWYPGIPKIDNPSAASESESGGWKVTLVWSDYEMRRIRQLSLSKIGNATGGGGGWRSFVTNKSDCRGWRCVGVWADGGGILEGNRR